MKNSKRWVEFMMQIPEGVAVYVEKCACVHV